MNLIGLGRGMRMALGISAAVLCEASLRMTSLTLVLAINAEK
jgi:hypothetical protein